MNTSTSLSLWDDAGIEGTGEDDIGNETVEAAMPVLEATVADKEVYSGVDGIGMWKSWTHNYEHSRFACLDLLDNCFDATLSSGGNLKGTSTIGRVTMDLFSKNGIIITNNASKPIRPLKETLTAYRSQKNSTKNKTPESDENVKKDAIGEYGVGLKQACATLSNTSFVLTKNTSSTQSSQVQLQLGVIAMELQSKDSVSLPHFEFTITMDTNNNSSPEQQIHTHLQTIMRENPKIYSFVTKAFGHGNKKEGIHNLVQYYLGLLKADYWVDEPNVFQLIITNLIHTSQQADQPIPAGPHKNLTHEFLQEIRDILPKYYINIPLHNFQFLIQGIPVKFCYWQHRLVEMTKFEVFIPKDTPIQDLPDDTPWAQTGYPLSIYCGFDALRLLDKDQTHNKACQLHIYSRQSGRLIETTMDARDMLGMANSGVDYSQGLTILVDDAEGELPLKPTKDGLTWSKEANGHIHESNLLAWTGAVGSMYWNYHANLFKARTREYKTALSQAILRFVPAIEKRLQKYANNAEIDTSDASLERAETARFCMFSDVFWKKSQSSVTRKVRIQKSSKKLELWRDNTPATVWKFSESHYPIKQDGDVVTPKKRGRPSKIGSALTPTTIKKRMSSAIMRRSPDLLRSYTSPDVMRSEARPDVMRSGKAPDAMASGTAPNPAKSGSSPWDRFSVASDKTTINAGSYEERLAMGSPASARKLAFDSREEVQQQQEQQTKQQQQQIKELEEALQGNNRQIQELETDLKEALRQLMNPRMSEKESNAVRIGNEVQQENAQLLEQNKQLKGKIQELQHMQRSYQFESNQFNLQRQSNQQMEQQLAAQQQSLEAAKQENSLLQQENAQAVRHLQGSDEVHNNQLRQMQGEVEALRALLAQRKKTIQKMSGGFEWGDGTDEI